MKNKKRLAGVSALIILLIILLSQCVNTPQNITDVRGKGYTGSEACQPCHADTYESYLHAAHTLSSAAATPASVKGRFDPGFNVFHYRPNLVMKMEQRDSGLFQVAYLNNKAQQAFPIDIVIGSGRKAQTYLYWLDENVFQLPVSYSVKVNNWVNSPNYPPDKIRFDRLINVGCFECHGSFIKHRGTQREGTRDVDYFDKSKIIYGIDCERCHGPAAAHVSFHENNPQEKQAQHITKIASLSRQARLDMCAQCHSGAHPVKNSLFYFKPGDSLAGYFTSGPGSNFNAAELDVHGNQYQLLASSQCFLKSNTLDCSGCHNTHVNEREDMVVLSQRCINCHQPNNHNFCKMAPSIGNSIVKNCIDCHMPATPSRVISMKAEDEQDANPNLVRTHYISVYPEVSKKFLDTVQWK